MDLRRLILAVFLAFASLTFTSDAVARQDEAQQIDVPAGTLLDAINSLARQSRVTIGGLQSGLDAIRSKRVRGRMSPEDALRQLLAGTTYSYEKISARVFRLVQRPRQRVDVDSNRQSRRQTDRAVAIPETVGRPIVVRSSKYQTQLKTYPGSATIIDIASVSPARLDGGVEDIAASHPTFISTHLGPGRNKVFLRGFADSSFNGPTQSTTAVYLDDYRLVYSAPSPDLRAFDLQSIELLEGPQGSLYGAGSIGGTLRIQQAAADPDEIQFSALAGGVLVEGGGDGSTLSTTINLPVGDNSAIRLVGYDQLLPGYIDDTNRNLRNINRTRISGIRANFETTLSTNFDLGLSGLIQDLDTRDGQYSEPAIGQYARSSQIAQPFSSDVMLFGATFTRSWTDLDLNSATNWTKSELDSLFETGMQSNIGEAEVFVERRQVELLNHETRLSGGYDNFKWLVGVTAIRNLDRSKQFLGGAARPRLIERIESGTNELAGFSEVNAKFLKAIDVTAGVRLVNTTITTELDANDQSEIAPQRQQFRVLPTFGLGMQLSDDWYGYARYQEGFRSGGTTIRVGVAAEPIIQDFEADEVQYYEFGARGSIPELSVSELSLSISYAKWKDIQSDIFDDNGFPFTTNVGDGEIYSANVALIVEPSPSVNFTARAFFSQSDTVPAPESPFGGEDEFPNIPDLGLSISARFDLLDDGHSKASLGLDYVFVQESILGLQPDLDLEQGDYSLTNFWLQYRIANSQLSLSVQNLFNASDDRFAFGNPFTVIDRPQATPLQPRTLRLTVSHQF